MIVEAPDGKNIDFGDLAPDQVQSAMGKLYPKPPPEKPGNISQFGPTAMGATLSGLNDSGFVKGLKTGAEELPYGMAQAGVSLARGVGLKPPPGYAEGLANDVSKIEAQDKGTGLPGALGEMASAALIPEGGAGAKAKTLGGMIKQGAEQGARVGGLFSAIAPTTDPKQTLGQRTVGAAGGAAGGALLGAGAGALSAGVSKMVPGATSTIDAALKKPNDVQKAANFFGLNFSGAKNDEGIAQEIKRGVGNWVDRMGSIIADRTPVEKPVSDVGEVGSSIIQKFKDRKGFEASSWGAAEPTGNNISHDTSGVIADLKEQAKDLEEQVKAGTATETSKADLNLINGTIKKLGGVIDKPQNVITNVREVGGKTHTVTGGPDAKQFPKSAENTSVTTPEATTMSRNGRMSGSTESEPVNRQTSVNGKVKTTETSPYTVTTKKIKGEPPAPARQGTAGDLVRAAKFVNSEDGAAASSATRKKVRDAINGELTEVSKNNPQFAKLHKRAIDWTQRNADIYRDEGKLAKMGFTEKGLWDVFNKVQSPNRVVSADSLEKLNSLTDKIKTKEDLLFFRRVLPPGKFNLLMRAKFSTLMSDINMHAGRFEDARPIIEEMLKRSGMPQAKMAEALDHYATLADRLTDAGLDASGKISKVEKDATRMKELQKAVLFGGALGNPKQGLFHGIQAMMPSPTAEQRALRGFRKAAAPTATGYPASNIPGAAAGAIAGQISRDQSQ